MAKHTQVKADPVRTARLRSAEAARKVRQPKKPKVEGEDKVAALPPGMQEKVFKPGEVTNPGGNLPGKRLLTRIKEVLCERSIYIDPVTKQRRKNSRFDDVADAYVRQMEVGNFQHLHEYIEREEGKVKQTIDLTGDAIKLYVNTPTEGPDAP